MMKPELLAPAGDLEKLKIAILYGADAVFIGGQEYGLRANASNFSIDEIKAGCEYAHFHNAKVYITTNIYFHNENIEGFIEYIKSLEEAGVDAFITADIYALKQIRKHTNVEVHLSTQQSVMNRYSAQFFKELGVSRIVLARECNRAEIKSIKAYTDIEIEVFIHGSMCIGYSGRCMLSNHMTARDANRGGCSQNCRWEYEVVQDGENISKTFGNFSMNPDDLTHVEYIHELCEMGIESLKIEGRMRSVYYIANVVHVYRTIIDKVVDGSYKYDDIYMQDLIKSANRHISTQYFNDIPDYKGQNFGGRDENPSKDFCGIVLDYQDGMLKLEQRNYFKVGDVIEFIRPLKTNVLLEVTKMYNEKHEEIDVARHPQEIIYIPCELDLFKDCMARRLQDAKSN